MALQDIVEDGQTRIQFVPGTIEDLTEPTASEANEGVRVSSFVLMGGLESFEPDTQEIDNTKIESNAQTNIPGQITISGAALLLAKQEDPDEVEEDLVYETLQRDVSGTLIIRRYIDSDLPFTSGQEVSVYPGRCGETAHVAPEANGLGRYRVPWSVTGQPEIRAVIGGS